MEKERRIKSRIVSRNYRERKKLQEKMFQMELEKLKE